MTRLQHRYLATAALGLALLAPVAVRAQDQDDLAPYKMLRSLQATGGQLPKVIAAYNAGASPVSRWWINDRGDPLLWIESIPYWETRYYVPAVLRNMWVYQSLAGADTPTLRSMVQHKWPAFPVGRTNLIASTGSGVSTSR